MHWPPATRPGSVCLQRWTFSCHCPCCHERQGGLHLGGMVLTVQNVFLHPHPGCVTSYLLNVICQYWLQHWNYCITDYSDVNIKPFKVDLSTCGRKVTRVACGYLEILQTEFGFSISMSWERKKRGEKEEKRSWCLVLCFVKNMLWCLLFGSVSQSSVRCVPSLLILHFQPVYWLLEVVCVCACLMCLCVCVCTHMCACMLAYVDVCDVCLNGYFSACSLCCWQCTRSTLSRWVGRSNLVWMDCCWAFYLVWRRGQSTMTGTQWCQSIGSQSITNKAVRQQSTSWKTSHQ